MTLEDVRTEVLGCNLFLFEKVYSAIAPLFGRTPIGQEQDVLPDHPGLHSAVMAVSIALWAAAALALLWLLFAVVVPFALEVLQFLFITAVIVVICFVVGVWNFFFK